MSDAKRAVKRRPGYDSSVKVGAYEILSEIGRGGVGAVYRARSPDGRDVAVKVLLRLGEAQRARFERETRLLSAFTARDGFVPLLEASGSPPYLVMPLVPGGTLRERLKRGPLAIDETIDLGRALATALGLAHARGIVHRDLKPENILFTAEGIPLVADLGLAKHFDREAPGASRSVALSGASTILGTAGYLAPEQMSDARSVGPEADVFSLGAILYECLAGHAAFAGESVLEILAKGQAGVVEPLGRARPDAPGWLVVAVERALATQPERRFRDGQELGRALAEPKGRPSRAGSTAFVLTLVVAIAGGLGLAASRRESPRALGAAPAPAQLTPAPPPEPLERTARDDAARANELVDRAWTAFAGGDDATAIDDTTQAIALDAKNPRAWCVRGAAHERQGDEETARADLDQALAIDPRAKEALGRRAMLRETRGDHQGAIHDATRAIEIGPERADLHDVHSTVRAWLARGVARGNTGDPKGAIADLTKAIELDPTLVEAWRVRGFWRAGEGDHKGAIEDCTKAIGLDPELASAWLTRGKSRFATGDHEGGIADLSRAIELDSNDADALLERGKARRELADRAGEGSAALLESADADLDRAATLDPSNLEVVRQRGIVRHARGDLAGARADFDRVAPSAGENQEFWFGRALLREDQGDHAGAIEDSERAIRITDNTWAFVSRGLARASLGDTEGALADLGHMEKNPFLSRPIKARVDAALAKLRGR